MKSRNVVRLAGIVIGLALVANGNLNATPLLYGITNAGTLFTVDPTTLFTNTLGTVTGGVAVIGVATNGTNLYTFDRNTNRILQIDPNNANVLNTIDVGLASAVIGEGDLTYSSATQGFISSAQFPTSSYYSFTLGSPGSNTLLHTDSTAATRVFLDGLAVEAGTLSDFSKGARASIPSIQPPEFPAWLVQPGSLGSLTASEDSPSTQTTVRRTAPWQTTTFRTCIRSTLVLEPPLWLAQLVLSRTWPASRNSMQTR